MIAVGRWQVEIPEGCELVRWEAYAVDLFDGYTPIGVTTQYDVTVARKADGLVGAASWQESSSQEDVSNEMRGLASQLESAPLGGRRPDLRIHDVEIGDRWAFVGHLREDNVERIQRMVPGVVQVIDEASGLVWMRLSDVDWHSFGDMKRPGMSFPIPHRFLRRAV